LNKTVSLWISDKQDAFVTGVAAEFPDVPHRYCDNHLGVTTGLISSSPTYFAVEPLIFALHMEFPEVVPLPIEVRCAQIQHCLSA